MTPFHKLSVKARTILAEIVYHLDFGSEFPTQADIARRMTEEFEQNITPTSVSKIIDDLDREGFLKKAGKWGTPEFKITVGEVNSQRARDFARNQRDMHLSPSATTRRFKTLAVSTPLMGVAQ